MRTWACVFWVLGPWPGGAGTETLDGERLPGWVLPKVGSRGEDSGLASRQGSREIPTARRACPPRHRAAQAQKGDGGEAGGELWHKGFEISIGQALHLGADAPSRGTRTPILAPPNSMQTPSDSTQANELMTWALPVLLHRLANHTQWMTGFRSLLQIPGGEELLAAKSDDLCQAGRRFQEVGWLMAVLGSAQGGNLLLARREPQGLALMFELVQEGLQREARERGSGTIPQGPEDWPNLAPSAQDGWQIPFALGTLVLHAYRDGSQSGRALTWRHEAGAVCITLPWPESGIELPNPERFGLLGAEFHLGPDQSLDWRMPQDWFTS